MYEYRDEDANHSEGPGSDGPGSAGFVSEGSGEVTCRGRGPLTCPNPPDRSRRVGLSGAGSSAQKTCDSIGESSVGETRMNGPG